MPDKTNYPCWYCKARDSGELWSDEFDTPLHLACLREEIERERRLGKFWDETLLLAREFAAELGPDYRDIVECPLSIADEWQENPQETGGKGPA